MTPPPIPVPAPKMAVDVAQGIKLSEPARRLLLPEMTQEHYFDVLNRSQLYQDAIRLLARLLAPKPAIWWGCLCVWADAASRTVAEPVLAAAMHWLREPQDEHRRAVDAAAKAVGNTTAAGMVGKAVFLTEGSISVPGQPEVHADADSAANLIALAVLTAARSAGATATTGQLRQFLAIGIEVYQGKNSWERPK